MFFFSQILPPKIVELLQSKVDCVEKDLPLFVHCHKVVLNRFPTRSSPPMIITAPPHEEFLRTLQCLGLYRDGMFSWCAWTVITARQAYSRLTQSESNLRSGRHKTWNYHVRLCTFTEVVWSVYGSKLTHQQLVGLNSLTCHKISGDIAIYLHISKCQILHMLH